MSQKIIFDALMIWVTIEPISALVLFTTVTSGMAAAERRKTAMRATAYSAILLLGAIVVGQIILTAINIKVISLQVAGGVILFLFSLQIYANYHGRCVVSGDEADLRANDWSDIISSLRRVGSGNISSGPQSQGDWYIVLFPQTNYRGNPTNFNAPVSSLTGSNRRVGSVTIGRGVWQLCQGNHFTGRCVTLDQSVPDLSTHNMRNRISSLRPVFRQPH